MRLASRLFLAIALVLIIAGCSSRLAPSATAAEPTARLTGTWKLIVLAFGEDEFAIINVQ